MEMHGLGLLLLSVVNLFSQLPAPLPQSQTAPDQKTAGLSVPDRSNELRASARSAFGFSLAIAV